jgi:hypothetical protein
MSGFRIWGAGKHEQPAKQCNKTWGTCDVKTNDPVINSNKLQLPHICEAIGDHDTHECASLGCTEKQRI